MAESPRDRLTDQITRLQRPPRGRRLLSWLLFVAILVGFLVLPLLASSRSADLLSWLAAVPEIERLFAPHIAAGIIAADSRRPARAADMKAGQSAAPAPATLLALDRSWDPGPVAAAHEAWAGDCKLCHRTPFVRVQDSACRSCHSSIGDHVDSPHSAVAGITDVRCASCHRDHRGVFGLAEQNRHYLGRECASCHRAIEQVAPTSATAAVADFALAHPEFRVQLRSAAAADDLQRVRLVTGQTLAEPTNLRFPHDVHLASKGIDSPNGRQQMVCADCHEPTIDGLGFQPTTMRKHCQSCHALKLEPRVSDREVPHGPVADVLSTLREFYAYVHVAGGVLSAAPTADPAALAVQRPGQPARAPIASAAQARDPLARARTAAVELFEKTSCAVCHVVSRDEGPGITRTPGQDLPQWRIAPIAATHVWMPQSIFNHRTHAGQPCIDCHDAPRSKRAEDVLMPSIETCRDCHAGSQPTPARVTSDCGLCHAFHTPGRFPVRHAVKAAKPREDGS